jgi:ankyrin repeat protein
MRRLLAAGAEARCREPALGTTALVWAAANGKSEVVDLLLRQGADVRATDSEGATAVS